MNQYDRHEYCEREVDRKRVLVVDDDGAVCETLAGALKSMGMSAVIYVDSEEALRDTSQQCYGLAFIDLGMPGVTGLDLAQELRNRKRLEEIVFMSSHGTFEKLFKAIKIGVYDFLDKPLSVPEVRLLLSRYLERIALQKRIQETEQRHKALLQNAPMLIFTLGRNFSLEFINRACNQMLGYAPEEALSTPGWFVERVHPSDRDKVREAFVHALAGPGAFSLECRMLHKNGSVVHGIVRTIPSSYEESAASFLRAERVDGIFVDITDRVYLERALVQNEKLKTLGAISSEVAHEIRNPLMSIAGFARRLEKKSPESPEVSIILRESMRLEKLLNRIRDYLRPVEMEPAECDLNDVLSECVALLYPEMEKKGVWFQLDLAENLSPIVADKELLSQVFVNLMRMSLQSLEPETSFAARTFESESNVHVEFRNRLEAADLNPELLFMPFDAGGESAGLPLSYRLIKNMGGLLTFASDHGAAVFTVSLPKSGKDNQAMPPLPPEDSEDRYCFEPATGLLPRKRFYDLLTRSMRIAVQDGTQLSMAVMQLEGFSEYGAKNGEEAAKTLDEQAALAVGGVLCKGALMPARLGDGSYAAILPNVAVREAEDLSRQLCQAVERLGFDMGDGRHASLNVGAVTVTLTRAMQPDDCVSAAMSELRKARAKGRGAWRAKEMRL